MTKKIEVARLRYDEGCLAVHALNQIGDRWALLVVRELMFAPKRFQRIRAGMPGITAGVLTARLAQLQEAGVVSHDERLGVYALTPAGHGLLPVLEALCRWALTIPGHDPSRFISPTALMISMGVNLQPGPAPDRSEVAGFDFGREAFEASLADGRLLVRAVSQPDAPFVLKADGNAMAVAVYGTAPLSLLIAKGVIGAQGDIAAAQAFVDLFRLQPQA
ncbi:helix-turn-helix domain-containing protein [Aquamicrobium lusatiense]|uniref:winged helix-turn-helix transcriptional regulator n=1 Tax=Aquamicrobium lusatiense TaxID=89772 RepID=UPI002456C4F2|nr:helix-turn-helix domain-containing protein [Aquamicrobium lusatiense]MDH4989314.1 helix-turn-helix domain-containing protein [Aquamicrobium lusatiense]